MSLLKANSVQIGQSATATQNFTLSVPSSPDGTIKLARGNSGATTADILSVASNGRLFFNLPPIGSIIQIVGATASTSTDSSSTTYADTGLSASITPTSASNRILVFVNQNGLYKTSGNSGNGINLRLTTPSTNIIFGFEIGFTNTASDLVVGSCSFVHLDSPSTTSACTYKTQFANRVNATKVTVHSGAATSSIILAEVAT